MDSRRLRYFVQIVDSGSITRAAAVTGVAQPALSQQLAVLEHELKVKLLERSPFGVTPTAAGRILYTRSQAILRQFDELRQAVHREVQPLSGEVTIGMEVVDKLSPIPDEALAGAGLSQGSLTTAEGLAKLKEKFPEADYITKAYVKE